MAKLRELLERLITRIWYTQSTSASLAAFILSPLSWLYFSISQKNKKTALEKLSLTKPVAQQAKPKVIVIGNITAGGTGKTPFLIALTKALARQGLQTAIISRGHGGRHLNSRDQLTAHYVDKDSDPDWVGDEPLLVLQSLIANCLSSIPVVVSRKRQLALELLCEQGQYDIVLSDDGLQHYSLQRDIEIVLVDAARGFGNQKLLPAGPLREPLTRLANTDLIIFNGKASEQLHTTVSQFNPNVFSIETIIIGFHSLHGNSTLSVDAAASYLLEFERLDLVAGIGNPGRFFDAVRKLLASAKSSQAAPLILEHRFADHYHYAASDLQFDTVTASAKSVIIMTAKDAVKCIGFAGQLNTEVLVVDVDIVFGQALLTAIEQQLAKA